ncbi:DUF2867 domain-containing protein [Streptomyces palmae]|uniref:DUF2867 domain-containing protein n=1 Tax=Streptomyces palmae TaxID=1701085 RepID=A0A4Z0H720_9ACTN|nr:DUF2867 domain-containing protein [Streptomyces palmae]TGB09178.1 DUF2867 domain-containing protein [Streptomyces palmae]
MRMPISAHTGQPWRIHELTRDFRVDDVWGFRTPGAGPGDFPVMLAAMRAANEVVRQPAATRFLFAARWKLGALLGWDKPESGLGARVRSLREGLPPDMAATRNGYVVPGTPMAQLYDLDDEAALELANKTVHTVCHLGWVRGAGGDYELRMAALVKPNGTFGRLYMAFIKPFRYLVVYPALTRRWERAWRDRDSLVPNRLDSKALNSNALSPNTDNTARVPDARS